MLRVTKNSQSYKILHFHSSHHTLVSLAGVLRFKHARARQMPSALGRRKLDRPLMDYRSPGDTFCLSQDDSRTVLSPTKVAFVGRSDVEGTSLARATLHDSSSPGELLQYLNHAIQKNIIDASVFGAAMQRCGNGRWWSALNEVRELQIASGVPFTAIETTIYIRALASAVRGETGFGIKRDRQQALLGLVARAFSEIPAQHIDHVLVGATLNACAVSASGVSEQNEYALRWAEHLWEFAKGRELSLGIVACTQFALVLEEYNLCSRVDNFICDSKNSGWKPNRVLVGGLINIAAEKRNIQRAEDLWSLLVCGHGVQPDNITYGTLAKANLLCGQPAIAVGTIDAMLDAGIKLAPEQAELHIQALLIVCHSCLKQADLEKLECTFERGRPIIMKSSAWQRKTFRDMQGIAELLKMDPRGLRLHDVLLEWKARQSEMADWPNYPAGSRYLHR